MNNSKGKVLIAAPVHPVLTDGLASLGYECAMRETITQDTAPALIHDVAGVITSTRLQLDKELLDAAPGLQWIGRMGSGMEVIDVDYATQKGVACFSSPEGNANAVGEHAVGMLLALIRRITWSHCEVAVGVWKRDENRGYELEGKTIAIIGYGHTGAAFAKKLSGFDVRILAYDKNNSDRIPSNIEACSLETIYKEADIVSFHVPLQPDTVNYFNREFMDAMQKPFIVINTSRGRVLDTYALRDGIVSGKILGTCLDVFEQEPLTKADEEMKKVIAQLLSLPSVVVTPHIAGYTFEALYKMSNTLLLKIKDFIASAR